MLLCPCCSLKTYEMCCGLYLENRQIAQTPEQLMRSRYSAFSLAKLDYIRQTMQGKALIGFNEFEYKERNTKVNWVGLTVIQSYLEGSNAGFVEFSARFIDRNQLKYVHELSEFNYIDHVWYYVDGTSIQSPHTYNKHKIARNGPCPCGSDKNFKNCHENKG